jgi:hypothetical protein
MKTTRQTNGRTDGLPFFAPQKPKRLPKLIKNKKKTTMKEKE